MRSSKSYDKKLNDHSHYDSLQNRHPWYYVPGNRAETEKRLSAKHEKDSLKQRQNEQNNNYFRKCNSDMKLFSNWDQSKPLVRYHQDVSLSGGPFYIENKTQQKLNHKLYTICLEQVKELFKNYNCLCSKFRINSNDCSIILKYLSDFIQLYKMAHEKRITCMEEIRRHFFQSPMKNVHDPLRNVCFLIKELLYFYKNTTFDIIKLTKPIYFNNFLSEKEQKNLQDINNRGFQIIDMYIQLNEMRNNHFQQMYQEEKDKIWDKQKEIWQEEIVVWDGLIVKLMKSNYLLIKDKLQEALASNKTYSKERLENFEKLKYFIDEIGHDNKLNTILYLDIDQLSK